MQDDALSALDWQLLAQIQNFLQSCYNTTKTYKGQATTIDRVLPIMDFLLKKFKQSTETFQYNRFILLSIYTGWSKLRDYFNKLDCTTAYVAAIVLNPI